MEALHVSKDKSGQHYHSTAKDLRPVYSDLAQKYKMVIYSGDVDLCVPYYYSASWTRDLGFDIKSEWHPWESNSLQDAGTVVAGYAIEYKTNASFPFYFVTVKGSGHMVPQYKPVFGLSFLQNVLDFSF